jgi:hypothetical protein
MGGTPSFLITCLLIEAPLALLGMLAFRGHPFAVAAVIDVLLVSVITPHLPETAAAKARWATAPKVGPNATAAQYNHATAQVLEWIGRNITVSQYVLAGIALAAPFVMCLLISQRFREPLRSVRQ